MVKRDGREEPFIPAKANGWGEFMADRLGIDWGGVVIGAASVCPPKCTTRQFNQAMIDQLIPMKTDESQLAAGRLYAIQCIKDIHGSEFPPTVQEKHKQLVDVGLMIPLDYTDEEYATIERWVDHTRDQGYRHYQIEQTREKYALKDVVNDIEYETVQFMHIRMAMHLAQQYPKRKMEHAYWFYQFFKEDVINPPSPNMLNLGTGLRGYTSCCVYSSDDTVKSIHARDHIAGTMTAKSAGLGQHTITRSRLDPVRGGRIFHQGKLPYYRATVGMKDENMQAGRSGACTEHYTWTDPQAEEIQVLRNTRTPAERRIAGMDYSFGSNAFLARKAAKGEEVAQFSYLYEPELFKAQYGPCEEFERQYAEFMAKPGEKKMIPARKLIVGAITEAFETGRHYRHFTDTMNVHTPFKIGGMSRIWSSNLCQEIFLVTKPFESVAQLYQPWDESHGEIGLCNIGAIVVSNLQKMADALGMTADELHAKAAYYALLMADATIYLSEYEFPTLEYTAKARMSVGIGIQGLAHWMARNHLSYTSLEGRNAIHTLFESHYWHLLNGSLEISKERGNAPWMHKTKWPEGWLPIDTASAYAKSFTTVGNLRDWEGMRARIIANKGIAHSVLVAHMPGESSTIRSGTTNGVYPIRRLSVVKTNDTSSLVWVAPESTKLAPYYEIAYGQNMVEMIRTYGVMQLWTDQGISLDTWYRLPGSTQIGVKQIMTEHIELVKTGAKSTYYVNSETGGEVPVADAVCESCTL